MFKNIILLLSIAYAGISFGQNPQYLNNKIFFTDNYFFDIDSLAVVKKLNPGYFSFVQNDTVVFTSGGKNYTAWDKRTMQMMTDFDSALFNNLSGRGNYFHFSNIIYVNDKKFLLDNLILKIYDNTGKLIKEISDNESNIKRDINGSDFIINGGNCVLHVKDLEGERGFVFSGYDENGTEIYKTFAEHTDILIHGNILEHKRYLNYFSHNSKYAVFTSNVFYRNYEKTVIVNLASGEITGIPVTIDGILYDEQDNIEGLFNYNRSENELTFYDSKGKETFWKYKYDKGVAYPTNVSVLLTGNTLVTAFYHSIATGSDLAALDYKTGRLIWHADVDQVNASHSKYYNRVFLYSYKDKILMEGIEAYGNYLQVFDIKTGTKYYSSLK